MQVKSESGTCAGSKSNSEYNGASSNLNFRHQT
jgi:hypothetical protein